MIYYDTLHPASMDGDQLAEYLRRGWYRIQQTIITTDLIFNEGLFLPVFWLRLDLRRFTPSTAAKRILAANSRYTVSVKPFALDDEIESLYAQYRASVDFSIPETAREYLLDGGTTNIYETLQIEVRDGQRLIAAGFFDLATDCTTGILHIYHPAYRRRSLGKYLMLLEIDYCLKHDKRYYYPGYVSMETRKYDYKLFPDRNAAEVYIRQNDAWFPYGLLAPEMAEWSRSITKMINDAVSVLNNT